MTRILRPGLADILGMFLLCAVALIGGQRLFGDSDPAMHVATGQFILEHGQVPRTDPFSATHFGKEWYAHEWLADVFWALAHRYAGWQGLLALSAALIAGTHVLLYRFLVRRGARALPAFVATTAAAGAAASHWLARPHLLTTLLLVAWVAILDDVAGGRSRPARLWLLPLLAAIWANLHGGFLVGFAVLGCYAAAALFRDRSALRPLLWTGAGCMAAVLVNPWGWRLPAHLIEYFVVPREALRRNAEFAPASISDRAGIALLGVLAIAVAVYVLACAARGRGSRTGAFTSPDLAAILGFALSSILAVLSIRHAEIASVFVAILISRGLSVLLDRWSGEELLRDWAALDAREARSGGRLVVASALIFLAVLAPLGVPSRAGYDPERFPVQMVRVLRAEGLVPGEALFSLDLWGGYLVLEWPEARVFVDGRSDMFGDAHMQGYAEIYEAKPGWSGALERAGVSWALLPPDAPVARAMAADRSWEVVRADAVAVLFGRRAEPS